LTTQSNPTFQQAVAALNEFWAREGCLLWQPYYTQVGAGTMNPATFLRVLGPEPWRVAYVEPSVRPDDARYGENPNRMGLHYQYQVILKPEPGNPQELYLRSLAAIGIDLSKHDIRFVEDNWQQPALGAWGLGWEVWLDGLEITQFTYFQQAGGMSLDPVSVELTYGLERLLMAMQGVDHFAEIRWDERRTFGDLNLTAEREHSKYYFETADVELLKEMYDDFEAEARRSLEAGLVMPAYDYLLKCSHSFNIMDTRGAVGVTERASYFSKMREIAREIAQAYVADREAQGFPWAASEETETQKARAVDSKPLPIAAHMLLEIGTEELPPGDLDAALSQLERLVEELLKDSRLDFAGYQAMGTPRRLIVYIEDLSPRQADVERVVKGPPWSKAFDADGEPTTAAAGFASSHGISADLLERRSLDGGEYAVAAVREQGRSSREVLATALPGLIGKLRFNKTMRWDGTGTAFSRPIRWLLALHGENVIDFEFAGLISGTQTRGLRRESIEVLNPEGYFKVLSAAGIIPDPKQRRSRIADQVQALAEEVAGSAQLDSGLLVEVTNMVEAPTAVRGQFEHTNLVLPAEVLISVMQKHQRYFPVEIDQQLAPYFIAVGNGIAHAEDSVIRGNEQVIKARFADAEYFVARDLEQKLEEYLPALETMTFHAELGSIGDKSRRIEKLAAALADNFDLAEADRMFAQRAAKLCKADLATRMVVEMTALQGVMGRYYAETAGEAPEVAEAILEHYLPRYAGDRLPDTDPGLMLALADRLDTLMGLFAVGVQPTGTRDPYGLRRAAIGLVQILVERDRRIDLREALSWAAGGLEQEVEPDVLESCLSFIARRQQRMLLDRGQPHDVVEAILAQQSHDPAGAAKAVEQLSGWVQRTDWMDLLNAFARSARITRDLPQQYEFDEEAVAEEATRQLYRALMAVESSERESGSVTDFLETFRSLVAPIDQFFEQVLVMDEDATLRESRLGLLQRIVRLPHGVVDLARLEGF
jgi:glycyl-tRNA synthetase